MKQFATMLLMACVGAAAAALAAESVEDRTARELKQLQKELSELSGTGEVGKLEKLQRRFVTLQKEQFDLTKGQVDRCPVHSIKMPIKEVPVAYGLLAIRGPRPDRDTRTRKFPFARDWIAGGCDVSKDSPKNGKVFVCPKCVQAEKAWMESHQK